ncbi:MAG: DUF2314 domain-containing protein [Verrucomicrobia bacterium]|nr:DUF2314 domain-containing protein [Verrucomicrobiota bacterium]
METDDDQFSADRDEPLFVALRAADPELVRCKKEAQRTLGVFLKLQAEHKSNLGVYFAFKTAVCDGNDVAHLWYSFLGEKDGVLQGEHFELPPELQDRTTIEIQPEALEDWMINDHGVLYGGLCIRYQRSLLPESQRPSFDRYAGVDRYGEIE